MAFIPRPLKQLFSGNEGLGALKQRAEDNEALLHLVKSRLPDPLCDHCIGASLHHQILQLVVDSPVWNTRLRFLQGTLFQALALTDIRATGLKVITRPMETAVKERPPRTAQHLSSENARILKESAANIKNEALQQAMVRLASRFL
jgi:hypothetical protein